MAILISGGRRNICSHEFDFICYKQGSSFCVLSSLRTEVFASMISDTSIFSGIWSLQCFRQCCMAQSISNKAPHSIAISTFWPHQSTNQSHPSQVASTRKRTRNKHNSKHFVQQLFTSWSDVVRRLQDIYCFSYTCFFSIFLCILLEMKKAAEKGLHCE